MRNKRIHISGVVEVPDDAESVSRCHLAPPEKSFGRNLQVEWHVNDVCQSITRTSTSTLVMFIWTALTASLHWAPEFTKVIFIS